jgi:hypothetical protein
MGIRRRKRKLSTLMSRLDQRVRSVELRPISLLTDGQVQSAVNFAASTPTPVTLVSGTAPNEWRPIHDAYYYPKKLTGSTEDRVEIYLEADISAEIGTTLAVSGIHGTSTEEIDVDSDAFSLLASDTLPWSDRPSYSHNPETSQLPGVTITNTYSFKPETLAPSTWTTRKRLQTKRAVDSFEITGLEVTLTMNAVHKFEAGNEIYINILIDQINNDESRIASGMDGFFYIDSVTDNTITYTLTAGVDEPTDEITPVSDVYVFPLARSWVQVGSIWVNSSSKETYYWDGLRWVEYTPTSDIGADGDPPNPPTSINITSDVEFDPVTSRPVALVTTSWSPPTTSVSGDTITDLAGHLIRYRAGSSGNWSSQDVPIASGSSYTFSGNDFRQGTAYSFEVLAYDSGDQYSAALLGSHTTAASSSVTTITSIRPTAPTSSSYLGTITLVWDGGVENTSGVAQNLPPGLVTLQVHRDAVSSSFTPSLSSKVASLSAAPNQTFVDVNIQYGTDYYYKFVLEDANTIESLPSLPVTGQTASLVDAGAISSIITAANITPGTIVTGENIIGINITGQLIQGNEINGDVIKANTLEANRIKSGVLDAALVVGSSIRTTLTGNQRVELNNAGIFAYDSAGTVKFQALNNGNVFIADGVQIGGYATSSDLSSVSGVAGQANQTANQANQTAGQANQTAGQANQTAGQAAIDVNAAETAISNVRDSVYYPGTTQINGGNLRTGTVVADNLAAGFILGDLISTGAQGTARIEIRGSGQANPGIIGLTGDASNPTNFRFYNNGQSYLDNVEVAGTLSVSGNITGGLIRTSSGSKRAQLNGSSNSLEFYSGSALKGDIEGTSGGININGSGSLQVVFGSNTWSSQGSLSVVGTLGQSSWSSQGTVSVWKDVNGVLRTQTSDRRLKQDIQDIDSGLDKINQLQPVTFKWMNQQESQVKVPGLIAQDVARVFPPEEVQIVRIDAPDPEKGEEFVTNPPMGLESTHLVPYLIKAIQELSEKNDALEARLEALEGN